MWVEISLRLVFRYFILIDILFLVRLTKAQQNKNCSFSEREIAQAKPEVKMGCDYLKDWISGHWVQRKAFLIRQRHGGGLRKKIIERFQI